MPDIMKMKPKESDGVDSVIIVDGVPVVGTDRYRQRLRLRYLFPVKASDTTIIRLAYFMNMISYRMAD
jgi:hypothetical protein